MQARTATTRKLSRLRIKKLGSGVARYYQLYELLSNALNDGTIPPGAALPSEPSLVSRHHVSRTTVRKALDRLESENRIVRFRGSGTFARQTREVHKLCLNLHSFYEDVPAIASRTSVSALKVKTDVVPAILRDVQAQLGERPLVLERVRKHQGTPYQLSTTYVPESVRRHIRGNKLRQTSIVTLLDQIGLKTVKADHTMSAVAADASAARQLAVPLGSPLLRMRAELSDTKGRVRAVYDSLSRPDHFNVRAQLERKASENTQNPWRLKGSDGPTRKR